MNLRSNIYIQTMEKNIYHPYSVYRQSANKGPTYIINYFILLMSINFVFFCILSILDTIIDKNLVPLQNFLFIDFVISYGIIVLGVTTFLILAGIWLHIWIRLFKGQNSLLETIKAVIYSSTPGILFFWIPVIIFKCLPIDYIHLLNKNLGTVWISIIIFLGIWGSLLLILGIKEQNRFSLRCSIIIFCCSLVIPIICYYLLTVTMDLFAIGFIFQRF